MASTEGIASATSSLSSGSPEAVLKVDHVQAAALGLTPSAVVSQVRNILSGMNDVNGFFAEHGYKILCCSLITVIQVNRHTGASDECRFFADCGCGI